MKILSFAATNSRSSINKALVTHAARRLTSEIVPQAEVNFIDLNDYDMPIYSIDRETESGIPAAAQDLFAKIGAADALLISFAEHNGSVTSAWKNVFDWMSRIEMKLFQDKPMVILAATPGPRAGAGVLGHMEASIPFFGGQLASSVGIGTWGDAWDAETQTLTNPDDISRLDEALAALRPTTS
jgi:NAD(P)H-dependent FMN reductase